MAPTNAELLERIDRLEAEQARAGGASHNPPDSVTDATEAKLRAIADQLAERDHLKDCPEGDGYDGLPNVEAYEQWAPANPKTGKPERSVTVVRCLTCGGSTVKEQPFAEFTAAVDAGKAPAGDDDEQ